MSIQILRGKTSSWNTKNPVLLEGQPGLEFRGTDTNLLDPPPLLKIGDGKTNWANLNYLGLTSNGSILPIKEASSIGSQDNIFQSVYTKNLFVDSIDNSLTGQIQLGSSSHTLTFSPGKNNVNIGMLNFPINQIFSKSVVTASLDCNTTNYIEVNKNLEPIHSEDADLVDIGSLEYPWQAVYAFDGVFFSLQSMSDDGIYCCSSLLPDTPNNWRLGDTTCPWSTVVSNFGFFEHISDINCSGIHVTSDMYPTSTYLNLGNNENSWGLVATNELTTDRISKLSTDDDHYIYFGNIDDLTILVSDNPMSTLGDNTYPWTIYVSEIMTSTLNSNGIIVNGELIRGDRNGYLSLGTDTYRFSNVYTNYTHTMQLSSAGGASTVGCNHTLRPMVNSTSASTGVTLGNASFRWQSVWAQTGSVQTSDRSAKTNIHYLDDTNETNYQSDAQMIGPSIEGEPDSVNISEKNIIDFVKSLRPATFIYKNGQNNPLESNCNPEDVQLGLIADDIENSDLFKYVGVKSTYKVPNPDKYTQILDKSDKNYGFWKDNDTGEVLHDEDEKVEKITKDTLGLQTLPLAVLALTACKYLIKEIDKLNSKIKDLSIS